MADFSALKTAIQTYIKQNGNEEITGEILQEILLSLVTTLGDSAINNLVTALADEVAARQNADGTLQQNITNEATARGNGDTALSNRLGSTITSEHPAAEQIGEEAEAREAADTALQGLIDGITDNIENGYVYAGIATPSITPATGKVFYLALTAGTYTNFGSTVVSQGINILKYNGSAWSLDAFIGIDDIPTPNSPKLVNSGGVFDKVMTDGSAFDISAHFASGGTLATYADLSAALTALDTLSASYKRGGMSIKFVQSSDNKYVQFRYMSSSTAAADFTNVDNWLGVDKKPVVSSNNLVESGGTAREFLKLTGQENRNVVSNLTIAGGIDTSGEELNNSTATTSFKRSDFILVCKGSVINYALRTPTSYLMIALYNSDKEFVSGIEGSNSYNQGSLDIDIDGYIKISCRNTEINNNAAVANIVYDGEIKKGDKENAEKISELNLYNKNKYNDITNILIEQGCVNSNGEKVNSSTVANYHRSVLLKVYKGISIIYNNLRTPAGYNMISLYNDSGQYIEGIEGIGAITSGRYIPSSDGYICVSSRDNEVSAGYSSIYIEGTEYITKKVYDGELVDSSILYLNNKKQYLNILQNYKRMPRTGSAVSTLVPFSLVFFSDIHGSKVNLGRIIEFTTEYADLLDDTLCGGDLQSGVWTDGIAFWTGTPDANKILITIGNHDVYGETPQDREPRADVYQRFIGDFISNWGNVVQPANAATNSLCYYYKDYSDSKIRLIVLDSMYYDTDQENWLNSVLSDAKTNGLSVIISSHYAPDQIIGLNTSFQTLQQMSTLTTLPISAAAAVQSFINDGGKFVCWLTGHLHNDMFGYSQIYNNQLIIIIGCATSNVSQNATNDIEKVDGTKSMDEFDIINIDSYNKILKILRVGADKDSFGRSRFSASVNYETKAVLWND